MSHSQQAATAAALSQLPLHDLPAVTWTLHPTFPEVLSGEIWTADKGDPADQIDRIALWAAVLNVHPEASSQPNENGGIWSVTGRFLGTQVNVWTRLDAAGLAMAVPTQVTKQPGGDV